MIGARKNRGTRYFRGIGFGLWAGIGFSTFFFLSFFLHSKKPMRAQHLRDVRMALVLESHRDALIR